jgi:aminopeptidase N
VAKVRNLTHAQAIDRARLLDVRSYDITIDLTDGSGKPGDGTFRTVTVIVFDCAEPDASTVIDVAAHRMDSAVLNGTQVDLSGWSAEMGLPLAGLAARNSLVVEATFDFSHSGQGLHRVLDPVDKEVYLYSHFATHSAQQVYACFDQPDLKSVYTWHVTVPAHWKVFSNAPIDRVEAQRGARIVHFAESVRMSTYTTAICAGPFHEVREVHDAIDLGLVVRQSMASHLDADELFLLTKQGLDFYQEHFGVRYPLPKYDQIFVPEYNMGAMENFGCVTYSEQRYIFRSPATNLEYEQRAKDVLHEMAHMWFGNLVTMRWWDDLWLSESFAEWAAHWALAEATRFANAWTAFLSVRKRWAYGQDQLSSTHPVYHEITDVAAVEVNFDGITYYKGASIIKQLVARVGIDALVQGVRRYFAKHAWGNATFGDLLAELSAASGQELTEYANQWLSTAQVNTLRPIIDIAPDGTYARVSVEQSAPASHPTLRRHRIGVGLYDLTGSRLVGRATRYVDIAGERTELPELTGVKAAEVVLLNDEDHTYAKLRLDDRSFATVVEHLGGFDSSLARALCWAALWDMVYDAELPSRDFVALVSSALPVETDINVTTATLAYANTAVAAFADEAWQATGWSVLASTARQALAAADPASGFQLAWARAFASAARTDEELAIVRAWLDGVDVPPGLSPVGDFRWHLVAALSAAGKISAELIEAEHAADPTTAGDREAVLSMALLPTAAAKAAAWAELTNGAQLPNWRRRALLQGFHHPSQVALTQPYLRRFFRAAARVWAEQDGAQAQEFIALGYPRFHISSAAVWLADDWLAETGHPAPLCRLMTEGRDAVNRSLTARRCDGAALD